jgi:hypothetical protein
MAFNAAEAITGIKYASIDVNSLLFFLAGMFYFEHPIIKK